MQVKVKKIYEDTILPVKANKNDAGFDCYAQGVAHTDNYIEYNLGFQMEIPEGYFGLLAPRSSISNFDLMMKGSVGIIDSGYRGEVKFRAKSFGENIYKVGDRVCQLIILPLPMVELVDSEELDSANDRLGGFGSTGTSKVKCKKGLNKHNCDCYGNCKCNDA
jgi:dUTP pyrophosphatase